MSKDRSLYLCLFAAVFSCYAYCAYPTIAPRDSADLASAAVSLGVAHPPGYPLYSVLGKAWITSWGLANPAYRLNLLSAACGALAVLSVFAILRRACGLWPALAGAAAFAFSSSLWKFSLLEEKYSLQALFASALLFLAMERDRRRFLLSALLFGLGLVNHQTLILLAPALAYLWRARLPKGGEIFLLSAGLALYAAVWILLKDSNLAWAVLTRAEYGTLTLSGQFSAPLSLGSAWRLLSYFVSGLTEAVSWPVLALACLGALELWKDQRELGAGLALAFLAFGPFYFLLTRFDVSGWIARSVLEPAFIVPSLVVCAAAGFGARRWPAPALALAVFSGFLHYSAACHRDDYAAYDYVKDLRRFLPPGSAAIVAGDTALFGLRYMDPDRTREVLGSMEDGRARWLESHSARGPVFAVGLPENDLKTLGYYPNPQGPVQELRRTADFSPADSWPLSVLRPLQGDSYSRDVQFSYAYARFLDGRLEEADRWPRTIAERDFRTAALLAPETYRLERVPE